MNSLSILKKKFCLLLTATPVQNKLEEIFNLVSLLKPGHLGDITSFEKEYRSNKRSPKNEEKLKELVNKVMVRNRREDTGIEWTKRIVETVPIEFSESERAFYKEIEQLKDGSSHFALLTLKRELCSSREAAFMTLKNMIERAHAEGSPYQSARALLNKIGEIEGHAKAEKALELIQQDSMIRLLSLQSIVQPNFICNGI